MVTRHQHSPGAQFTRELTEPIDAVDVEYDARG